MAMNGKMNPYASKGMDMAMTPAKKKTAKKVVKKMVMKKMGKKK